MEIEYVSLLIATISLITSVMLAFYIYRLRLSSLHNVLVDNAKMLKKLHKVAKR